MNYGKHQREALQHGKLKDQWSPPPREVERERDFSIKVQRPDRDLILLNELALLCIFDIAQVTTNLSIVSLDVGQGGMVTGVLLHPGNWNPPPNCFWVKVGATFAFRSLWRWSNASDDLCHGQIAKVWTDGGADLRKALGIAETEFVETDTLE